MNSIETDDTVEIVNLSAQLAVRLARNLPDYQRKVSSSHVSQLREAMESGKWKLSPDALVISRRSGYDEIENGQHRVLARVQAGSALKEKIPVLLLTRGDGYGQEAWIGFERWSFTF